MLLSRSWIERAKHEQTKFKVQGYRVFEFWHQRGFLMMGFGKKQAPLDPVLAQEMRQQEEVKAAYQKGLTALRDFIAPSSLIFEGNYSQIGTRFARTYYVYGYPRQVYTGWLSGMINLDQIID